MFQPKPLPRTLDAALRDIQHRRRHVRQSAVSDLGRLARGDARTPALAALVHGLANDSDAAIRGACALALADADAQSELDALVDAAKAEQVHVAEMALVAIRELSPTGHRGASAIVRYHLKSDEPPLRFQALTAASRVLSADFERVTLQAMDDPDAKIRYLVLRLSEERWPPEQLPTPVKAAAEGALKDADPRVRTAAAMLLAPLGDTFARQALVQALNERIALPAAEDEQTLIEMVGELDLKDAMSGLRAYCRGRFGLIPGRFAWQARVAMARLGDVRAIDAIRRGLASRNVDTRALAVAAAGQARLKSLEPELIRLGQTHRIPSATLDEALQLLREVDTRH